MSRITQKDMYALAYELPDDVVKYKMSGDLAAARAAAERWLEKDTLAAPMRTRLELELVILDILPRYFIYTAAEAVEAFREKVTHFEPADLERLDREGIAEWIWVNGEKRYIHNLVRNALMKDAEISSRDKDPESEEEEKRLLKQVREKMEQEGSAAYRFRVRESIRLKDEYFRPGMKLKVHLPLPARLHQVREVQILETGGAVRSIDPEDSLHRAVCFEETLQENREFFVEYSYTVRNEYRDMYTGAEAAAGRAEAPFGEEFAPDLAEQLPHIVFTPYLRALTAQIVGDEVNPLAKARLIYDYMTKNVKYSLMRPYSIMEGIAQYCARNLRGDCGVQALLFITLCRIAGVPARWQSGLYTHPCYIGGHDWAMFYDREAGWVFADLSYGSSAFEEGDEERRRFYFGNLDPFRMPANHSFAGSFADEKAFWPHDTCDNQLGEIESDTGGFIGLETINRQELICAEEL